MICADEREARIFVGVYIGVYRRVKGAAHGIFTQGAYAFASREILEPSTRGVRVRALALSGLLSNYSPQAVRDGT